MSRSTAFLGRLQLFSKGNAINEGLIPPGTYGIPESDKKIVKLPLRSPRRTCQGSITSTFNASRISSAVRSGFSAPQSQAA